MNRIPVLAVLLGFATSALAQYPSPGTPEPSFNGGRPRIVELTPTATGYDVGTYIATLSGTRFAVIGTRPKTDTDLVLIVDTAPERVTPFEPALAVGASTSSLQSLSVVDNGTLLIGGYELVPSGTNRAWLELREVGVGATPGFTLRAALRSPATNPDYPVYSTSATAVLQSANGEIHVWQVRTGSTVSLLCSVTSLHRLDVTAGAIAERYAIDVTTAVARVCFAPAFALVSPARTGDALGAVGILLGGTCQSGRYNAVCVTRVVDAGGELVVDRSYGTNGVALYAANEGISVSLTEMKLDAPGNLVISTIQTASGTDSGQLIRFSPDGSLDRGFGTSGVVEIPSPGGPGARALGVAVTPDQRIVVVGSANRAGGSSPYLYYINPVGGVPSFVWVDLPTRYGSFTSVAPLPAGGALAVGGAFTDNQAAHTVIARLVGDRQTIDLVEYYNAGFDHFFVATVPDEIRKLDDGTFAGWQRTGQSFAALPLGAVGAVDVCRFFSTKFGPRSSHFYTPIASECAGLKSGDVWGYEGLVFALQSPAPNGGCPAGTQALYRLYNDGQGGAPNHRYTVKEPLRMAQVARGWIGEGSGTPPVFACVPL